MTIAAPADHTRLARNRGRTTRGGRPPGSAAFIGRPERALGRCLRPLPVCPPSKRTRHASHVIGDCRERLKWTGFACGILLGAFVGCQPRLPRDQAKLMRLDEGELIEALRYAEQVKDPELLARTVIAIGMTAKGSDALEAALARAFWRVGRWSLSTGVEWPDKLPIETSNRVLATDSWGRRNVTIGWIIPEAVERIESRSDYDFGRPLFVEYRQKRSCRNN